MTLGLILLFITAVLVFLGFAQRILDRLYLTDLEALLFLGAMLVGSFINIPISRGRLYFSLNVGGGLLPLILAVYLLVRAGTAREWGRALAASVVTGALIFGIARLFAFEEGRTLLDPTYVFALVAGVVGYVAGRSRRGAFVAAVLGLLLADLANVVYLAVRGLPGRVVLGGAGAFDTIVIAGIIALALAELIGESRERLQGGPATSGERPSGLHHEDMEMAWETHPEGLTEVTEKAAAESTEGVATKTDSLEIGAEIAPAIPARVAPAPAPPVRERFDLEGGVTISVETAGEPLPEITGQAGERIAAGPEEVTVREDRGEGEGKWSEE